MWEWFYFMYSKDGVKGYDVGVFKDWYYFWKVFGELVDEEARAASEIFCLVFCLSEFLDVDEMCKIDVLEFGCGVGNLVFLFLRVNLNMRVVAVDCSSTAIAAVRANLEFDV